MKLTINGYDTMEIMQAVNVERVPLKFFSTLFTDRHFHVTERVQFDYKKGRKKMAPFVAPRIGGKVMDRDGFSTFEVLTPKIAPERVTEVDNLLKRTFGEGYVSIKTPEQRANELFIEDISYLEEAIDRRVEWMCMKVVTEGKLDIIIPEDGVNYRADFLFTNKETLTGGATWDNQTSTPLEDLEGWRRTITRKTGFSPEVIIMGDNAYKAFFNNERVQKLLDIRNLYIGHVTPKVINTALSFRGHFTGVGDIYTFDEWYLDEDNTEKPYIDTNTVLILPQKIGRIHYGAVTQMEGGEFITYTDSELIPKILYDDHNDIKKLRFTSRPLPVPFDADAWYVAKVL